MSSEGSGPPPAPPPELREKRYERDVAVGGANLLSREDDGESLVRSMLGSTTPLEAPPPPAVDAADVEETAKGMIVSPLLRLAVELEPLDPCPRCRTSERGRTPNSLLLLLAALALDE